MALSSVDFPEPLAPVTSRCSPLATSMRDTWSRPATTTSRPKTLPPSRPVVSVPRKLSGFGGLGTRSRSRTSMRRSASLTRRLTALATFCPFPK